MASPLFAPFSKSSVPNLRVTPSLSPGFTTPSRASSQRAYKHQRTSSGSAENRLSLRRVIGCSTTAFASHAPSRSFAYTAGAAAVVVQLDEDLEYTQRFFRARPNAPTISVPNIPIPTSDTRNRVSGVGVRDNLFGYVSPATSTPFVGGGGIGGNTTSDDSPSAKAWSSKERIKAATCVSFSPDGKWLAVGEVCLFGITRNAKMLMGSGWIQPQSLDILSCSRCFLRPSRSRNGGAHLWRTEGCIQSMLAVPCKHWNY